MDLRYSPEDLLFRDATRHWLEANVPAEEPSTLDERRAWHRRLYEAGYVGMGWPVEYGGRGATPLQQAIAADEMARAGAPAPINPLGIAIVGPTLIVHGTEAQKARYLRNILTAEELWCQLYSEPNAGSDLASLRTRAEDRGDRFVVNGQKIWTSGGLIADWGLLLARTDTAVAETQGHLVLPDLDASAGRGGAAASPDHRQRALLRGLHDRRARREGRPRRAAGAGLGDRPDHALLRARRQLPRPRDALRRRVPPADPGGADAPARRPAAPRGPAVRGKLGRIYAELEVQRYAALRVLSALEKGESPGAAASITKLSYSEFEKRYHELVQEILGPWGQDMSGAAGEVDTSSGEPGTWATAYLWSRAGTIYSGSSEIQKNIIGERVLGLPKEIRADRARS